MNPQTSSCFGCTDGTGLAAPTFSSAAYDVLSSALPSKFTTCSRLSTSSTNFFVFSKISLLATSRTFVPLSLRMYFQSFSSCASYIGTYCAPSP